MEDRLGTIWDVPFEVTLNTNAVANDVGVIGTSPPQNNFNNGIVRDGGLTEVYESQPVLTNPSSVYHTSNGHTIHIDSVDHKTVYIDNKSYFSLDTNIAYKEQLKIKGYGDCSISSTGTYLCLKYTGTQFVLDELDDTGAILNTKSANYASVTPNFPSCYCMVIDNNGQTFTNTTFATFVLSNNNVYSIDLSNGNTYNIFSDSTVYKNFDLISCYKLGGAPASGYVISIAQSNPLAQTFGGTAYPSNGKKLSALFLYNNSSITTPFERTTLVNGVSDGSTWVARTTPAAGTGGWKSVAYGNGLFVAVAASNSTTQAVMTSQDGITWTARNCPAAPSTNGWNSVCYGSGLFVAVSNTPTNTQAVMTSPDGITWTIRNNPPSNGWQSVCYGNGLFVAVSGSTSLQSVMTSSDGITWTIRNNPAAVGGWVSVCYGNGLFVAVAFTTSTTQAVMTSPDGITWTARTNPAALVGWISVCYGNGLFVAVAQTTSTTQAVMTSPDGITWTARTNPAAATGWQSVCYGNGGFIAVAGTTSTTQAVMFSYDGITWYARTSVAPLVGWNSVCYGNGLFVAVALTTSTTQAVMTSSTASWYPQVYPVPASGNGWRSVTYGNGLFVAVASTTSTTQAVMTSPDGITWTARTNPAAGSVSGWFSVCYGNGLFVAVANSTSTTQAVMTSPDGITWTARTNPAADVGWISVCYGNGLFVATAASISTTQAVMTSPDGITWTARTNPAAGSANGWVSVTYGNGLFVAVAGNNSTTQAVMTSPDGITWTARTNPAAGSVSGWFSVCYGNGLFVAVANTVSTTQAVMTSPDGITWTARTNPATDFSGWRSVTYGNGLFVAVAYTTSTTQAVITSPDGITWTARTNPPASNGWWSVCYGNGLFVAVANTTTTTGAVMTSPDGIGGTVTAYGLLQKDSYTNKLFLSGETHYKTNVAFNSISQVQYSGVFSLLINDRTNAGDNLDAGVNIMPSQFGGQIIYTKTGTNTIKYQSSNLDNEVLVTLDSLFAQANPPMHLPDNCLMVKINNTVYLGLKNVNGTNALLTIGNSESDQGNIVSAFGDIYNFSQIYTYAINTTSGKVLFRNFDGNYQVIRYGNDINYLYSEFDAGIVMISSASGLSVIDSVKKKISKNTGAFIASSIAPFSSAANGTNQIVNFFSSNLYSQCVDPGSYTGENVASFTAQTYKYSFYDSQEIWGLLALSGNYYNFNVSKITDYTFNAATLFSSANKVGNFTYVASPYEPIPPIIGYDFRNNVALLNNGSSPGFPGLTSYDGANFLTQKYQSSFRLFGNLYVFDGEFIYNVPLSAGSTGQISAPIMVALANGLRFLCVTPQTAVFLSEYDNTLFIFDGGRDVKRLLCLSDKPNIISAAYCVANEEMVVQTTSSLLFFRSGIISEITAPYTPYTSYSLQASSDGVWAVNSATGSATAYFYKAVAGGVIVPLNLQTIYWGYGSNRMMRIHKIAIRLRFYSGTSSQVTVTWNWFTDTTAGTSTATVTPTTDANGYGIIDYIPNPAYVMAGSIGISSADNTQKKVLLSITALVMPDADAQTLNHAT